MPKTSLHNTKKIRKIEDKPKENAQECINWWKQRTQERKETEKMQVYCRLCKITLKDEKVYERHAEGKTHKERMIIAEQRTALRMHKEQMIIAGQRTALIEAENKKHKEDDRIEKVWQWMKESEERNMKRINSTVDELQLTHIKNAGHLEYLEATGDPATGLPIGGTSDNLKAAVAGETHEYTDMYPGMTKTAREEGMDEIADWFETLAKAERSHANRFTKALDNLDA